MRKVINGRAYDTETAEMIADIGNDLPRDDAFWDRTQLYRTKKGAFFIQGEGGGNTRWGVRIPAGYIDGAGLLAIDEEEARRLVE